MRQRLTQLLSKMEGNDKLEQMLADVLEQHRKGHGLGQGDSGIEASGNRGAPEAEVTQ